MLKVHRQEEGCCHFLDGQSSCPHSGNHNKKGGGPSSRKGLLPVLPRSWCRGSSFPSQFQIGLRSRGVRGELLVQLLGFRVWNFSRRFLTRLCWLLSVFSLRSC